MYFVHVRNFKQPNLLYKKHTDDSSFEQSRDKANFQSNLGCFFFAGGEPVMSEGPLLSQRLHRPRKSHPSHSGNHDLSFNSYCKHKCVFKTLFSTDYYAIKTFSMMINELSLWHIMVGSRLITDNETPDSMIR